MAWHDLAKLGAALLLGMALAFPLGMMVAGDRDEDAPTDRGSGETAQRRDIFSPKVLDDPYFVQQQRRNVAALEARCRDTGEMCAEARAARGWLRSRD